MIKFRKKSTTSVSSRALSIALSIAFLTITMISLTFCSFLSRIIFAFIRFSKYSSSVELKYTSEQRFSVLLVLPEQNHIHPLCLFCIFFWQFVFVPFLYKISPKTFFCVPFFCKKLRNSLKKCFFVNVQKWKNKILT